MEFEVGAWKPLLLPVAQLEGPPKMYPSLRINCKVVERLNSDLTMFDAGSLDLTLRTPDGGVGDGGFVTGYTIAS